MHGARVGVAPGEMHRREFLAGLYFDELRLDRPRICGHGLQALSQLQASPIGEWSENENRQQKSDRQRLRYDAIDEQPLAPARADPHRIAGIVIDAKPNVVVDPFEEGEILERLVHLLAAI